MSKASGSLATQDLLGALVAVDCEEVKASDRFKICAVWVDSADQLSCLLRPADSLSGKLSTGRRALTASLSQVIFC